MRRFVFSAQGALRWKRDLSEYCAVLRACNSTAIDLQVRPTGLAKFTQQCDPRAHPILHLASCLGQLSSRNCLSLCNNRELSICDSFHTTLKLKVHVPSLHLHSTVELDDGLTSYD